MWVKRLEISVKKLYKRTSADSYHKGKVRNVCPLINPRTISIRGSEQRKAPPNFIMQARPKEKQTNLSLTLIYHWINKPRTRKLDQFPRCPLFLVQRGFSRETLFSATDRRLFRIHLKLWLQFVVFFSSHPLYFPYFFCSERVSGPRLFSCEMSRF